MKAGRPKLPEGCRFFSIQLSPANQAAARKLGGQITPGIRKALDLSIIAEERRAAIAKVLKRAVYLNEQIDSLQAERHMISEQIYELQFPDGNPERRTK